MGEGSPAYRVSKAALNALTCTLAPRVATSGILVNSMSPGWVQTDMGGEEAPRSVEEGADTAAWLCLLPSGGPTGQFFRTESRFRGEETLHPYLLLLARPLSSPRAAFRASRT
jgi:NAD(P)-dependent dehydrogenase (short-subunit alcohol dehydrogenase family)